MSDDLWLFPKGDIYLIYWAKIAECVSLLFPLMKSFKKKFFFFLVFCFIYGIDLQSPGFMWSSSIKLPILAKIFCFLSKILTRPSN